MADVKFGKPLRVVSLSGDEIKKANAAARRKPGFKVDFPTTETQESRIKTLRRRMHREDF